jgi:hypothetical protein
MGDIFNTNKESAAGYFKWVITQVIGESRDLVDEIARVRRQPM